MSPVVCLWIRFFISLNGFIGFMIMKLVYAFHIIGLKKISILNPCLQCLVAFPNRLCKAHPYFIKSQKVTWLYQCESVNLNAYMFRFLILQFECIYVQIMIEFECICVYLFSLSLDWIGFLKVIFFLLFSPIIK